MDAQSLRPIPWAMFSHQVLQLYRPPMRRPTTRAKLRQVLKELGRRCETTADLTVEVISDYVAEDHAGHSPAYVDGLLRALSAACSYGAHPRRRHLWDPFEERAVSEWLPGDELEVSDPWPKHRTADETRKVLAEADSRAALGRWRDLRLRWAVYAWAYTGALKSEILGLERADLDVARGLIRIRSHSGRRLKERARASLLPMAAPLLDVTRGYLEDLERNYPGCRWAVPHHFGTGPWLSGRPGHRPLDEVRELGRRAGVEGLTILSFRHTLATRLEAEGVPDIIIQRILRHASRRTQLSYRNPDLPAMRQAFDRLAF